MDIERINIYERLRDFKVPTSVLDNIFSEEGDYQILLEAFKSLTNNGQKQDQAADKISKMIFKELNIEPDHSMDEEK
tara:strand:- start:368 stop:598 length:231 start_codon:yes stop_codon:yes gene_type:complete